jgi:hypothetical protein
MRLPSLPRVPHLRWRLLALAVQAVVLTIGVWHHEPWTDEAQAWLLARDSSPVDLVLRNVRYEGSPPLWHLLLMLPAKAGLPYRSASIIGALAAWIGACLFVLAPAVPTALCLFLPFGYYFVFQFAVVARNYTLLLPLLGLLIHFRRSFAERPGRFHAVAILISWSSLHGGIVAGAILAGEWLRIPRSQWRRYLGWLGATAVSYLLIAAVVWLPRDYQPIIVFDHSELAVTTRFMQVLFCGFMRHPISMLVFLASVLWFHYCRVLFPFALGFLGLAALAGASYVAPWHFGVAFLMWSYCVWIGYQNLESRPSRTVRRISCGFILAMLFVHVYFGLSAHLLGVVWPYSGSRAAAAYLRENLRPGDRVFGCGYKAIALQPYFRRNLYANLHGGQPPAFWRWSPANGLPAYFLRHIDQRPEYIVLASDLWLEPSWALLPVLAQAESLRPHGYSIAGIFAGRIPWYDDVREAESYVVLRRDR